MMFAALYAIANIAVPVRAKTVYSLNVSEAEALLSEEKEVYGRTFTDGVYLFSDPALEDKIFELPKSFYIKILTASAEYCRAVYCYEDYDYARAVTGYVRTGDISLVDEPPTGRSFPNIFLDFEGNGTFYKNNRFDSYYSAGDSADTSDTFFYGYYMRGTDRYCYVLRGGKFGYYSADVFENFVIPTHIDPAPLTKQPEADPPPDSAPEKDGLFDTDAGKVIFIAVTCIIAVSVAYLIFLPKKRREIPEEEPDYD